MREDPKEMTLHFFDVWLPNRRGWTSSDRDFFPMYKKQLLDEGYYFEDLRDEGGVSSGTW
jgi:hypothetical protein